MLRNLLVFIFVFGFIAVGYSVSANADGCREDCDVCQVCVYDGEEIECECSERASQFKSRGECISTYIGIACEELKGKDRKACNAEAKDFCDCAVYHGCTDLPPGPPEGEDVPDE